MRIQLELPTNFYEAIWHHLLQPIPHPAEESAFLFAHAQQQEGRTFFRFAEWEGVGAEGFLSRSPYHLELTDEARASAIKRAHDLGTSLLELHSHPFQATARLSKTDLEGLREFVPHVWWRLRNRPYAALVVSPSGFDGLAWIENPDQPCHLEAIVTEDSLFRATKATPLEEYFDVRPF